MRLIDIDNITALDIMHNVICDKEVAHKMLEFLKEQPTIQPQGIDKDRLIEELENKLKSPEHKVWNEVINMVVNIINRQPTVQPQERPKGRWIYIGKHLYKCSECCFVDVGKTNYCPACGADMRESE